MATSLPFFTDLAADFVHVDVTELRAVDLSVHIPPPGYACAHPAEEDIEPNPDEPLQHCELVLEDGSVCGKQFHSLRDLLLHQRRSKAFNHSTVSNFCKVAHVNQCPWCFMVHANTYQPEDIRQRLHTGVCPSDSRCGCSVLAHQTPPADLVCKFCGHEGNDLLQLFLTSDLISCDVHSSMDSWLA